jgi:hypothetical protein
MIPARAVPVLVAALLAVPAFAGDSFEALATGAERLDSLEPFLSRWVGSCKDPYERRTCEAHVAADRRALSGKTFTVRVSDAAPLVRPKLEGERFLLLVTPFVDGGGLALTHGAPLKQNADGHPLIAFIPIRGKLAPGTMDLEFEGPFRTGAIDLEIVFRPERTWRMKRKGETGEYAGVAARFLGIRVLNARTGSEIASRVL